MSIQAVSNVLRTKSAFVRKRSEFMKEVPTFVPEISLLNPKATPKEILTNASFYIDQITIAEQKVAKEYMQTKKKTPLMEAKLGSKYNLLETFKQSYQMLKKSAEKHGFKPYQGDTPVKAELQFLSKLLQQQNKANVKFYKNHTKTFPMEALTEWSKEQGKKMISKAF